MNVVKLKPRVYKLVLLFLLLHTAVAGQSVNETKEHLLSIKLSGNWLFCKDEGVNGEKEGWYKNGLPAAIARPVKVPHTWNVEKGMEEYDGTCWYQTTVELPEQVKGKQVRIQCNAIYRDAVIYLNGIKVGEHKGSGYTKFFMDLSKAAKKGRNLLVISVNNQFSQEALPYKRSFDWANDGGIIRDVFVLVDKPGAIDYLLADARPIAGTKGGELSLQVKLLNQAKQKKQVTARIVLQELNQETERTVFTDTRRVDLEDGNLRISLQVPEVNTWHFDHPHLYRVRVEMLQNGAVTASKSVNVGFRSIEAKNGKIYLNGEAVRLPALEWMPGSNPNYGMAEPPAVLYGNLEQLKKANAVFTRFHWQQDDALLDWCDRHGLLVQEEIPMWGADPVIDERITNIAISQANEMVTAHYNHPSVIAWGVGNEQNGQAETTQEYVRQLYRHIKKMDVGRLVNYVSNSIHHNPKKDATVFGDVIMWNEYYETWFGGQLKDASATLDSIHRYHPGKPVIISEYGLCEPAFSGGDQRRIVHMLTHTAIYADKPFVAGAIYFSLNDYRTFIGEAGEGRYRQRVHGVVDLSGKPKPSYYFLANLFSPVKIVSMKASPDSAKVNIKVLVPEGIPAYSLSGYGLSLSSSSQKSEVTTLPLMEPGKSYSFSINNIAGAEKQAVFTRPNGEVVLAVPMEQ